MNSKVQYFFAFLLIVYSLTLIITQVNTSEDYVRQYFTDIKGDVAFYAVNTSISAFLLAATGLVFVLCIPIMNEKTLASERIFIYTQIFVFFYLAIDDRFQIHDAKGLPFRGEYLFLLVGFIEGVVLLFYAKILEQDWKIKRPLFVAAVLFCIMFVIDIYGDKMHLYLRLSFEDLCKTWANVFFFLFSYQVFLEKLNALKRKTVPMPV
jgi:hypothetical protein